jgi:hypothetical protein
LERARWLPVPSLNRSRRGGFVGSGSRRDFLVFALATVSTGCRGGSVTPVGPGALVAAYDELGARATLRIESVETDPLDPDGEVFLYETSVLDSTRGVWKPFCAPDRDSKNRAIPLHGSWDTTRTHVPSTTVVTFACTSGAIGKCVRLGYKPWKTLGGVPLASYHQACVHMVPADYCGDGRAHTRDGTLIAVYDRLGIQKRAPSPGMVFEAAWSPQGAIYLNRPRYGGEPIGELVAECPDRLHGRTGGDAPSLDPQAIMNRWHDALIITESRVTDERP